MEETNVSPLLVGLRDLRRSYNAMLTLGLIVLALGVASFVLSFTGVRYALALFGILLFVGGLAKFVNAFSQLRWGGHLLSLAAASLYVVPGILLIENSRLAVAPLTMLMTVFLLSLGLFRISASLTAAFPGRAWLFVSGVVSLALGLIAGSLIPTVGIWLAGLFIGIEMIVSGWQMLATVMSARRMVRAGVEEVEVRRRAA